jgi:hypothetical protein
MDLDTGDERERRGSTVSVGSVKRRREETDMDVEGSGWLYQLEIRRNWSLCIRPMSRSLTQK